MKNTLKIQIWSDVMCPFCYIGKRRIEEALTHFEHKDNVAIEWKSFQLDPNFITSPNDTDLAAYLAEKYGRDIDWAHNMLDQTTQNAKTAGLDFHFEKAIRANSFNAHRLLHLAKKHQLADALEELLFKAYFTDGKNIDDSSTLLALGIEAGLKADAVNEILNSDVYANDVKQDQEEANAIGVQGVPFFVLDNKYAVSGAQPSSVFLQALEKVWQEGQFDLLHTETGKSCDIDECD